VATEIERKFLIRDDSWDDGSQGLRIAQGYLSMDPDRTVRVRLAGENAWITVKGRSLGITRVEFEYQIPPDDALCLHMKIWLDGKLVDESEAKISVFDHGSSLWRRRI
jgi:adenylate cyclase